MIRDHCKNVDENDQDETDAFIYAVQGNWEDMRVQIIPDKKKGS